jgi:hypothetical protein
MIIVFLINVIVAILSIIFGWLPDVLTLPNINGYDIDTAFANGMGQLNTIMSSVWVLQYLFGGFLFIMGYHLIKMVLKFILGSRSPHHN